MFEALIATLPLGLRHTDEQRAALREEFDLDPVKFKHRVTEIASERIDSHPPTEEDGLTKEDILLLDYQRHEQKYPEGYIKKQVLKKKSHKRKQGQKYPEGFTKKQILLKVCEKDKTSTMEIIDFLRDQHNISEQKNIREHLKTLEEQKLIKRESAGAGHSDYWYVNPDPIKVKKLLEDFIGSKYMRDFLYSRYCVYAMPDPLDVVFEDVAVGKYIDIVGKPFPSDFAELHLPFDDLSPVVIAVAESDVQRVINEMIIEHAVRLHLLLYRFYPRLSLTTVLGDFLTEVRNVQKLFKGEEK